jgi:tape measure domain-containing protein
VVEEVGVHAKMRDELSQPLRQVEGQARRTGRALRDIGDERTVRGSRRLGGEVGKLGRQVGRLDRGLQGMSRTLSRQVTTGVRRTSMAVGALTIAIGVMAVRSASNFEQTRIALDGMLGSAAAGARMFESAKVFNRRTPFELPDITAGQRQLLGFGFVEQQVMPLVQSVADVVAGLGAGREGLNRVLLNLGQVQAQGVVTGRELRDFATIGFPGYELVAHILGKTKEEIRAMGDDAEVSADQFITAVTSMAGPLQKFGGMAEKQMNSLWGLWSNVKDAWNERLVDQAHPLTQSMKDVLRGLPELAGTALDKFGPPLFDLLGMLVEFATDAVPVFAPLFAAIVDGVRVLLNAAGPGMAGLGGVVGELTRSVGELVRELVPVMPDLVDAFLALVGVLPEFVRLLGRLVPLVTPLAGLATELLSLDGVAAALLATLLGYRALRSVVGVIMATGAALQGLAGAQVAAAAASTVAAGAGGAAGAAGVAARLGTFARGAGALGGAGLLTHGAVRDRPLETVAGGALAGAVAGSVIPGVGTLVGGGLGALGGGAIALGRRLGTLENQRERQVATAPVVRSGAKGGDVFHTKLDVHVDRVESDVDIARAVWDAWQQIERERTRRG